MSGGSGRSAWRWLGVLVILLAVLHQDVWFWDNRTLVLGFIPLGLFYHMLFSIAAASLWALALKFAWPADLERWADETSS